MITTVIRYQRMMLVRRREAFDDRDWLCELKWDGWRSLAYVTGGGTTLVSRNGNPFRSFPELASLLSFEVDANDAVLDGEVVKLDESGRPQFLDLMRRRGPFQFVAFDVLQLNGKDVRKLPLTVRKHLLRAIIPEGSSSALLRAAHRRARPRAVRGGLRSGSRRNRREPSRERLQRGRAAPVD